MDSAHTHTQMVNIPYVSGQVANYDGPNDGGNIVGTVVTGFATPLALGVMYGPHAAGVYTIYQSFWFGFTGLVTGTINAFMNQADQWVRNLVVLAVFGFACFMIFKGTRTAYDTMTAPYRAMLYVTGLLTSLLTDPARYDEIEGGAQQILLGAPDVFLALPPAPEEVAAVAGVAQEAAVAGVAQAVAAGIAAIAVVAGRQYCGRMTRGGSACRRGAGCTLRH